MSRKRIWILLLALFLVIVVAIGLGATFYLLLVPRPATIEAGTVVEVKIKGELSELPLEDPFLAVLQADLPNLWDLGKTFEYAAQDDRVSAILLEIQPLGLSWAQVEELRELIRRFRESGKPVHAFLAVEGAREIELYLACAADTITLNPTTILLVDGLMAEVTFFKQTLEKLAIKPQFIQLKEYKSAEQFTRESLSPEIREMLQSILADLQNRFTSAVASDRGIAEETLQAFLDKGIATAEEGLQAGLVDSLSSRTALQESLQVSANGEKVYRSMPAAKYRSSAEKKFWRRAETKVAVMGAQGAIIAGDSIALADLMGGSTVSSRLREIREDDTIAGLILRVNSPGGSVVGSDMVLRELELLQEAGKPVVVSMSGVAGSGGYYISMGANKIVSHPSTITGSIGVIFGKFDVSGLLEKLGMTIDRVKMAPHADLFSPFSSLSQEQLARVQALMEETYRDFVNKAAEERGMEFDQMEALAHGRIYSGQQALKLGLVDDLGGLSRAVVHMKSALGLAEDAEVELVLYPKPKTLWETLMSGELFDVRQPAALLADLKSELDRLTLPSLWYLTPEIRIR